MALDYILLTDTFDTWRTRTNSMIDLLANSVYTSNTYSNPSWLTGLAWSKISSTPTTLSGYGITDAQSHTAALDTFSTNGSAFYLSRGNHTGTQSWSTLTSVPTTIAGFGITDGVSTGNTYSNPSWLTALAWVKLTGVPTTVDGYGITDTVQTGNSYSNPSWIASIALTKVTISNTSQITFGSRATLQSDANGTITIAQAGSNGTYNIQFGNTDNRYGQIRFNSDKFYFLDSGFAPGGSIVCYSGQFTSDLLIGQTSSSIYISPSGNNTRLSTGAFGGGTGVSWDLTTDDTLLIYGRNRTGSGSLKVTGALGFATGAGGSNTQTTSKSTGVTLNKNCGRIVTHDESLSAGVTTSFVVTNSAVANTDTVVLSIGGGVADPLTYRVWVDSVSAGSFRIAISNISAGPLGESVAVNFTVLKGVTS